METAGADKTETTPRVETETRAEAPETPKDPLAWDGKAMRYMYRDDNEGLFVAFDNPKHTIWLGVRLAPVRPFGVLRDAIIGLVAMVHKVWVQYDVAARQQVAEANAVASKVKQKGGGLWPFGGRH